MDQALENVTIRALMQPWKTTSSSLRETNHGIFSYVHVSLEIPAVMALLSSKREGAAAVNTPPSTKHKAALLLSSEIYFFAYFISDGIFVFRSVFSSVLGGMCVLGPWSDNDGLLAGFFVLQHNAMLTDQAKKMAVGSSFVERESSGTTKTATACLTAYLSGYHCCCSCVNKLLNVVYLYVVLKGKEKPFRSAHSHVDLSSTKHFMLSI